MTLVAPGKPARMRTVYGDHKTTATDTVYTCPDNCTAEITFIHVINTGGSTNSVTVQIYVAAQNYTSNFLAGNSLGSSNYITFVNIDVVLQPGDQIRVTPSSAGHIDSIITATETFIPVG